MKNLWTFILQIGYPLVVLPWIHKDKKLIIRVYIISLLLSSWRRKKISYWKTILLLLFSSVEGKKKKNSYWKNILLLLFSLEVGVGLLRFIKYSSYSSFLLKKKKNLIKKYSSSNYFLEWEGVFWESSNFLLFLSSWRRKKNLIEKIFFFFFFLWRWGGIHQIFFLFFIPLEEEKKSY